MPFSSNVQITFGGGMTQQFHKQGSLAFSLDTNARGSGSAMFLKSNLTGVQSGVEISVFLKGVKVFGGTVESVDKQRIPSKVTTKGWTSVEFTSWEHRLESELIQTDVISGMNAGDTFKYIVDTYQRGAGFTYGQIEDGIGDTEMGVTKYQAVSIAEALDDLATRSNYLWGSSPDKVLYFVPKSLVVESDLVLTNAAKNIISHKSSESRQDYANAAMTVIGWDQIGSTSSGELNGDGSTRDFTLPDVGVDPARIDHIEKILLNGVEQNVGVTGVDTDKDFYWSSGNNVITQDSALPLLTSADVLEIFYFPLGRNVITYEDEDEITARQAIEGGSGRYEVAFQDTYNSDQVGALNKLKGYLDKQCPGRNGKPAGTLPNQHTIIVNSYVADAVTSLQPGQVFKINDTNPDTGGETSLIVQNISCQEIAAIEGGGMGFLQYTVAAMDFGRRADFVDYFKGLIGSSPGVAVGGGGSAAIEDQVVFSGILGQFQPLAIGNHTNLASPQRPVRLTRWKILCHTADKPTGIGAVIVDMKRNGASILNATDANKIKLVSGTTSNDGTNFLTDPVDVLVDDELELSVIAVGGTFPGALVTVEVAGKPI